MSLIPLSEIASAVNAILPTSFTDEMRKSVQIAVLSTIRKMNLVTQEDVEEQEKTLLQLREKIEALEGLVALLQKQKQAPVEWLWPKDKT
jgi:BMFP domain-containing protein YqiC